ncbi:hypothetical protein ZWY2020_013561 [Hordeum vulgare]|nr:hypothetical protein ZWY2020_013561 [Hordeum vulgare]
MAGAGGVGGAHEVYRGGRHREALELYSAALAAARGHAQRIALHSNRAACYPTLPAFHKAAEECTSVLELDTEHAGALMLRAQTLVTLKDYQSALFDVNRLIEINPSSEVYRNLHARLKTQLSLAPIPESDEESLYTEEDKEDLPPKDNMKNETALVKSDQPSAKLIPENKPVTKALKVEVLPNLHSKPEGLDYSKWDKVENDSSEDDDDDEEDDLPRYKFKVRTIGVCVKHEYPLLSSRALQLRFLDLSQGNKSGMKSCFQRNRGNRGLEHTAQHVLIIPTKPTNASGVLVSFPDTPSCQRAIHVGRGCDHRRLQAPLPGEAPDDLVFAYNGVGLLVPQATSSPSSSSYQQQHDDVVAQLLHEAADDGALLSFENRSSNSDESDEYQHAHCSLAEERRRRMVLSKVGTAVAHEEAKRWRLWRGGAPPWRQRRAARPAQPRH